MSNYLLPKRKRNGKRGWSSFTMVSIILNFSISLLLTYFDMPGSKISIERKSKSIYVSQRTNPFCPTHYLTLRS